MEEYNVLVLMEKDKENGFLTDTIDSYAIDSGAEGLRLVEGIYLLEEPDGYNVFLTLTTEDVEDWEYYGMYELYDEEIYSGLDVEVLDGSGEYNPRWIIRFGYSEDRQLVGDMINRIITLHKNELERIRPLLQADKERFMAESSEEEN